MNRNRFYITSSPPREPKKLAAWIALLPILLVHDAILLYSRLSEPRKRSRSIRKRRERDVPAPLKLGRRRALSSSPVKTNSNIDCPLLARLPQEVRLQIWQYAMGSGGCHYHLMHGGGTMAHALCQSGDHDSLHDLPNPCCQSRASRSCCPKTHISCLSLWDGGCVINSMSVHNVGIRPEPSMKRANLKLLRTCRQIYQEAAQLPYSTNIFDVDDLITLIYWSRTILPNRLAVVRNLRVNWEVFWPPLTKSDPKGSYTYESACRYEVIRQKHSDKVWLDFWDTVATKMVGLQDLRITIDFMGRYYRVIDLKAVFGIDRGLVRSIDASWLKPILNIRGIEKFELEIVDGRDWQGLVPLSHSVEEVDMELKDRTERLLGDVRRIVCKPPLS